jgi:6-phosphogluconolactonase (cycloisomerase 2 family)
MKGIGMASFFKARGIKTLGVSLAVGLGMTACSRDYTVAYLYVTSATKAAAGVVNEYAIDYQSGALTPLAESSVPSGGDNPVSLVASPNQKNIYVINQSAPSSNVVEFSIGTDGKLYPENTYSVVQNTSGTITGSLPTAIAIDPNGKFLYVTFQYQNGFTTASPGPGGIAIYPINSDGSLAAPLMNGTLPYTPVGDNPVGIVVTPNGANVTSHYVYVIDQEKPTTGAFGVLLTFLQNSDGSLTQVTGEISGGVAAGTTPGGIAEDPGGNFIYVTDETTNQLYGYLASNTGAPVAMSSSPYATGSFPEGVTVDPRGEYVYVANFGSGSVSSYAIKVATGALSGVAGTSGTTSGPGSTCVTIEPALGVYLFASNYNGNTVSAAKLSPNTGALSAVQNTPFDTAALPTCAVAVGNGAHSTQIVE